MASRKRRPKKSSKHSKKSRDAASARSTQLQTEKAPSLMLLPETEAVAQLEKTVPADEAPSADVPSLDIALPADVKEEAPTAPESLEPGAESPSEAEAAVSADDDSDGALPANEAKAGTNGGPSEPQTAALPDDHAPIEPASSADPVDAPAAEAESTAAPAESASETSDTSAPAAPALPEVQASSAPIEPNEPNEPTAPREPSPPAAPQAHPSSTIGLAILAAGAALAAAGLLLFAAAHWLQWAPLVRLGLFGALLLISALPLLFQTVGHDGRATPQSRRRAGIASLGYAAAIGLFLAAHGQTYQTGAGASTLCALWFALLLPWVLWLRRAGIFIAAFLIGLAATVLPLWENDVPFEPSAVLEGLFPAALFASAAILILAPLVRRAPPSNTSLRAALLVPSIAAVAFVQAGIPAVVGIDEGLTPVYLALSAVTAGLLWLTRRPEGRALALLAAGLWANGLCFDVFSLSNGWAVSAALLFNGCLLWAIARAAGRTDSEHSLLNAAPRIAAGLLALAAIGLLLALGSIYADLSALPYLGAGYAALGIAAGAALRVKRWRRGAQPQTPLGTTIRLAALAFAFAGAAIIALSGSRALELGALSSQGLAGIVLVLAAAALPSRLALAAGGLVLGFEFDVIAPLGLAAMAGAPLAALARPQGIGLARALLLLSWVLLMACPFASGESVPDHWMTAGALGSLALAMLPLLTRGSRSSALPIAAAAAVTATVFLTKNAEGYAVMPILSAFLIDLAVRSSSAKAPRRTAAEPLFLSLLSAGTLAAIYAQAPASGENLLLEASIDLLIAAAAWLAAGAWLRRRAKRSASTPRRRLSAVSLILAGATAALLALGVLRDARDLAQAPRFLAAIAPADPRDILMGDFMRLRFDLLSTALQAQADRLRAEHDDEPVRVALAVHDGRLAAAAFLGADEAPPEGTVTTTLWRVHEGTAALPDRWYFPSGDAERFEGARFAALRCTANRCLIEGLADESGRLIESTGGEASLADILRRRFGLAEDESGL